MRVTPQNITELQPDEVFVFGSNLKGLHGAGAAKQAMKWGAIYFCPYGLQGRTYAIPTKGSRLETLEIEEIERYVSIFIHYASKRNDLKFLVTEIGCGLAGLTPNVVAPLFSEAVKYPNIYLPKRFWDVITADNLNEPMEIITKTDGNSRTC
jgi:hypothetical protein